MNIRNLKNLGIAILILTIPALLAGLYPSEVGTFGKVYKIVEPDFIDEMEQRAANLDASAFPTTKEMEDKVKNYQPDNLVKLPRAKKDSAFLVDPTYTLEFDIPDGKGGVIYPKGFTFNPLDYETMTVMIVVIDGSDPEQVQWFLNSPYSESLQVRLLLSGGNHWEVSKKLRRQVFYYMRWVEDRLHLRNVPSIVSQEGRNIRVDEIFIEPKT